MNKREKLIVGAIVGVLAVALLYWLVDSMVFAKARKWDKAADTNREKLDKEQAEYSKKASYERQLKEAAGATFASTVLEAESLSRARLKALAGSAGLSNDPEFTKLSEQKESAAGYSKIGWKVAVAGPLDVLTNFLYLVREDSWLKNVENIKITRPPRGADLSLEFQYTTLVFPPKIGTLALKAGTESEQLATLSKEEYLWIPVRDIFRPYVPRPEIPQQVQNPGNVVPPQQTPPVSPPGDPRRLVNLSRFGDTVDDIHIDVFDPNSRETKRYKVGEPLESLGNIVMVDYRPMPKPDEPRVLSYGRLITRQGEQYWAIELDQTLAQKRPLPAEMLPAELQKAPETQPAQPS